MLVHDMSSFFLTLQLSLGFILRRSSAASAVYIILRGACPHLSTCGLFLSSGLPAFVPSRGLPAVVRLLVVAFEGVARSCPLEGVARSCPLGGCGARGGCPQVSARGLCRIHISESTRLLSTSYVGCGLKTKKIYLSKS